MAKYPTPHINATPDDFGKTVLMPGDPKRSAYIAKNLFDFHNFLLNLTFFYVSGRRR